MNLDQIRADEVLCKWLASTINSKRFQVVMDMLNEQHPMRFIDSQPVTPSSAEKKLGVIEGYELVLLRLKLCTQYQPLPAGMPPATFEPEPLAEQ